MSVTFPTYVLLMASRLTGDGLDGLDIIFTQGLVGLVMVAAIADQQQWSEFYVQSSLILFLTPDLIDYQSAKQEYKKSGNVTKEYHQADLDRGFNTTGLWAYSRHPNFAAEQSIWVCLYTWSCFVTRTYYHWAGVGALSYLMLFQGSTWLTELLSSQKYPEYAEYQKRVGMFVPGFKSGLPGNFSDRKVSGVKQQKSQ